MTGRYVLAADVLAMLMGAAMLVMCVLAYMDGTHDLFIEIFCAAVCFVPFVLRRLRVISLPGMITFLIALAVPSRTPCPPRSWPYWCSTP